MMVFVTTMITVVHTLLASRPCLGKRSLSRNHFGKLARYFNVSPNVFAF